MLRAGMLVLVLLLASTATAPAATIDVTSNASAGAGTLRAAINAANGTDELDEIIFDSGMVIEPASALPSITKPVMINQQIGQQCTGAGYQSVRLEGNGQAFDGLHLAAGSQGSTICGLNVRDFSDGIQVDSDGNTIDRCWIGTNFTISGPDGNTFDGINVAGDQNVIDGNVLSGNGVAGLRLDVGATGNTVVDNIVGLDLAGALAIPNVIGVVTEDANVVGGGNLISGNTQWGVVAQGGTIIGNHIGTNFAGDDERPNGDGGVHVESPGGTVVIGGDALDERNVISGNTDVGVQLDTTATVQGNWIGPTVAGDAGLTGQDDGVVVADGSPLVEDNAIAGHSHYGVWSEGSTDDLVVRDNLIGLLPDGVTVVTGDEGVDIDATTENALVDGNTIAGHGGAGIEVAGTGTDIVGNTIGRDTAGAATPATANDEAIDVIAPADDTSIEGNRLSNGLDAGGVRVDSGTATLEGNVIDDNARSGVWVDDAADVRIGGASAEASNEIADNGEDGVEAADVASVVEVGRNSIHDNDDLGVDVQLDGVTANDTTDGFQDFPTLESVATRSSDTDVAGVVLGIVGHEIRVDVWASTTCDASGNGEGAEWLGSLTFTASGFTSFEGTLDGGSTPGRSITAIATDLDDGGRSSEFSECLTATQKPEDPGPEPAPTPQEEQPPPEQPAPLPPIVAPPISVVPPPPVPKFPAKVAVLRNGVDDGVLDMLIQITSRAETDGAELELDYQSSGRHTRFDVPIDGTQIRVRKKLPKSQPKDTGIVEIAYDGNDVVSPDEVRLRAADGKSLLKRTKSEVEDGRLNVEGTIDRDAEGVVRIRLEYSLPDGSTDFLSWNAKISNGKWKISKTLPALAAGGGQLSIQFTGYEKENLRGEQIAKQVLATP